VDAEYFSRFYDSFEVGEQGSITLLGTDGTVYSRFPFDDSLIGQNRSSDSFFRGSCPSTWWKLGCN